MSLNRSVALTRARLAAQRGGYRLGPLNYQVKVRRVSGRCQILLRRRNKPGDTMPLLEHVIASQPTWALALRDASMKLRPQADAA